MAHSRVSIKRRGASLSRKPATRRRAILACLAVSFLFLGLSGVFIVYRQIILYGCEEVLQPGFNITTQLASKAPTDLKFGTMILAVSNKQVRHDGAFLELDYFPTPSEKRLPIYQGQLDGPTPRSLAKSGVGKSGPSFIDKHGRSICHLQTNRHGHCRFSHFGTYIQNPAFVLLTSVGVPQSAGINSL
eukprot:1181193-Prorocentrum_minimum.AAC.5